MLGGKWKKISRNLPGRTSDSIKNRYYSVIKRKQPAPTTDNWSNFLSVHEGHPQPQPQPQQYNATAAQNLQMQPPTSNTSNIATLAGATK
jgi:hypothetical protein